MDTNFEPEFLTDAGRPDISAKILRSAAVALGATVWLSSTLFGLYILAFYAGAFADGSMDKWNDILPRLHETDTPAATLGIGLHFAAGGVILILGFVQLISAIRNRFPALHRVIGRIYVTASLLAGIGGLVFIALKGTIGGAVMNVGFGLYGILMIVGAVQTIRYARLGQLEAHRAWALRLFALAIGSWLYRMDYGFWLMLSGGAGHTPDFRGWFDMLMAFFFYIPNLSVAEAFIRGRRNMSPAVRIFASAVLVGASAFLILGTYYFTKLYWGPAIIDRLGFL
ncbi:MAG TPA: DUF2306 domain-containing protein [Pyrinomonadaceae bacterium]|jgi:uncharacterized membrane protein